MAQPEAVASLIPKTKRFGGTEWFLVVGLAMLGALSVLLWVHSDFIGQLNAKLLAGQELAVRYGYLGVFLSMLVGNLTIMIVLPTTIVPFLVAAAGVNPLWVGAASGLGAELGEYSGYVLGWMGSGLVANKYPDAYARVRRIAERRRWAIPILLFLFSLLPLPDDVLFIPLGIIRYPVWKVFIPSVLGKIIAGWFIAYGGRVSGSLLANRTLSAADLFGQIGFLGALVIFTYFLMKLPWGAVLKRFDR